MPILDATFLDTDPDGAELLRCVFDTGRRSRRRQISDFLKLRDQRPAQARPSITIATEEAEEAIHPGVLVAAAS